jgi:hypothetical protein
MRKLVWRTPSPPFYRHNWLNWQSFYNLPFLGSHLCMSIDAVSVEPWAHLGMLVGGVAGRHLQPVRLEMPMDFLELPAAEIMRLEQMPEPADRGLVGRRLAAEIDPGEIAHRRRVVKRLFDGGIGKVEK